MSSLQQLVAIFGDVLQQQLEQELGPLTERMQEFVRALALVGLDGFVAVRRCRGRRPHDRRSIARAFLAKAMFHLPHTRALLERLAHDEILRRLCGFETAADVPDETVFSRALAEFAQTELPAHASAAAGGAHSAGLDGHSGAGETGGKPARPAAFAPLAPQGGEGEKARADVAHGAPMVGQHKCG